MIVGKNDQDIRAFPVLLGKGGNNKCQPHNDTGNDFPAIL